MVTLEGYKEFLEQHLLVWCPELCSDMAAASTSAFYRGIALITREFLQSEPGTITELIEQLQDPNR
jgi:TorA maturation chaperone TorD